MRKDNLVNNSSDKPLMPMNIQFFAGKSNSDSDLDDDVIEEDDVPDDADNDEDDDDANDDNKDNKSKTKKEKSFNQNQVTKMMTREKKQGRNSAFRELGIDPNNKKQMEAVVNFIKSQKTDEQIAAEKEAESNSKISEAEERARRAEAKAEAMIQGVKATYVDDIVTLAMNKMKEDEEAEFTTVIAEFKAKYKDWFESPDDDDKENKGKKGTGSTLKKSKEKKEDKKGVGSRLAAQRRSRNTKKSYWS